MLSQESTRTDNLVSLEIHPSYQPSARSVRQVMDRVFSFLSWPKREAHGPWKQGRKKRGSINCRTDRANQANKMFIKWLCWLFRVWKGDRELEVRTTNYRPGIDQSKHAKSVSHIIKLNTSPRLSCLVSKTSTGQENLVIRNIQLNTSPVCFMLSL